MHHWFNEITLYIRSNPELGMLFAFIIAFAESLPIVGTIIPGSITMTAVGILIGRSLVPAFETILLTSLGAFCGDFIGFWLGLIFKEDLIRIWPFSRHPNWLQMGKAFFHRHGGKSIIIGRFVGAVRSCVPMIAGLMNMRWYRFAAAAVPSAVLWAILYLLPGILIGAISLTLPPTKTGEFILIGFLTIVFIWFVFWLTQYFFRQIVLYTNIKVNHLWLKMYKRQKPAWLIRAIANQQNPYDHHQFGMALVSLTCAVIFLLLFFSVVRQSSIVIINAPVFHALQSVRTIIIDRILVMITMLGQSKMLLQVSGVIAIVLLMLKKWRSLVHLAILMAATVACVFVFKTLSHSVRPTGFMIVASSYSFPSGHATFAVVFYGFMAFLTAQLLQHKMRWIPYLTASIIMLLVGFSRIYLGAHWLTDICGGYLLGLTLLLACCVSYRRFPKNEHFYSLRKRIWFPVLFTAIILGWLSYLLVSYPHNVFRYTPLVTQRTISLNNWWHDPHNYLPIYRNNRLGNPAQPLNIQWLAHRQTIENTLAKHGWQTVTPHVTLRTLLQRFASKDPRYHQPILRWLYQNRTPAIFMIHQLKNSKDIVELRLWYSHIAIPRQPELWIGVVTLHIPPNTELGLHQTAQFSFQGDAGLNYVIAALKGWQIKRIIIPKIKQPITMHKLHWDGLIVLIRQPRS